MASDWPELGLDWPVMGLGLAESSDVLLETARLDIGLFMEGERVFVSVNDMIENIYL